MAKPEELILPEDHIIVYNGVKVHWFIGDWNDTGKYWEAWGSCHDKSGKQRAYQMFAKYDNGRTHNEKIKENPRRLYDIKVLYDPGNIFFCEEIYKMLTE